MKIQKKSKDKKGFTLAELLIVVAIIAVLVAIAIPVFTSQLEKSREATDISNLRSYYAEITTALITGDFVMNAEGTGATTITVGNNLTASLDGAIPKTAGEQFAVKVDGVNVQQTQDNWQTAEFEIAGVKGGNNVTGALIKNWTTAGAGKNCRVVYHFKLATDGDYVFDGLEFAKVS